MTDIFAESIPEIEAIEPTTAENTVDQLAQPVSKRFAFVGAGACGGRLVNEFYTKGYRRTLVVNTCEEDRAGLNEDLEFINLDIGGSGKDPSVSKSLASRPEHRVQFLQFFKDILGSDFDYVFVCVGLGGGTGSGVGPEMVKLLREYIDSNGLKAKVGVILSFPQVSEGSRVAKNALTAYEEFMSLGPSPMLLIDNGRVAKIRKSTIASLHTDANRDACNLLHIFNTITRMPAIQTFDSADFGQLLDSGLITFGMAGISNWKAGSDVVAKTIAETYRSATLVDADLSYATQGVCVIVGGSNVLNSFSNDELMGGLDILRNSSKCSDMMLHPGVYENTSPGSEDSLRVYVALGGLKPNADILKQLAKVGNVADFESKLAKFFGM
jgi:cell division GTPase FtsZ